MDKQRGSTLRGMGRGSRSFGFAHAGTGEFRQGQPGFFVLGQNQSIQTSSHEAGASAPGNVLADNLPKSRPDGAFPNLASEVIRGGSGQIVQQTCDHDTLQSQDIKGSGDGASGG